MTEKVDKNKPAFSENAYCYNGHNYVQCNSPNHDIALCTKCGHILNVSQSSGKKIGFDCNFGGDL